MSILKAVKSKIPDGEVTSQEILEKIKGYLMTKSESEIGSKKAVPVKIKLLNQITQQLGNNIDKMGQKDEQISELRGQLATKDKKIAKLDTQLKITKRKLKSAEDETKEAKDIKKLEEEMA
jgi:septal ring factor EnvC (AmiA/AmiB activator)